MPFRIRPSMVQTFHIDTNEDPDTIPSVYQCKITLSDGRTTTYGLLDFNICVLINAIAKDKITGDTDHFKRNCSIEEHEKTIRFLREDPNYKEPLYCPIPGKILSDIFRKSADGEGIRKKRKK